jgi:hypothetical protein
MTQARVAPADAVMLWVRPVQKAQQVGRGVRAPQVLAMQRAVLFPEQPVLQVALWRWATLPTQAATAQRRRRAPRLPTTQAQAVSPSLQVRRTHRVPVAPHHAGTAVEG